MASRKDEKERLRLEREQREQETRQAERRKRLVGYGVGGGLGLAALVAVVVVLVAGGGGGDDKADASVLPGGGKVPDIKTTDLNQGAKAAGCELSSVIVDIATERHTQDLSEQIRYQTNPPAGGKHFQVPAEDGAYSDAPDDKEVVHSQEHGRVVIWYQPTLPKEERANLNALVDRDDSFQLLLVPRRNMPWQVGATAWNRDPEPRGTGRMLGCKRWTEAGFDPLQAFIEEHRGNGPELVD